MMNENRKIPYSKEAEDYVIGSILVENSLADEVINRLDASDFYIQANKNIINAIIQLDKNRQEIDISSVADELKRKNLLEATGGLNYLLELMDAIPSVINVHAYIEIIKEKSIERQLLNTMTDLSNAVLDSRLSFNDLISETERKIIDVLNRRKTVELIRIDAATDDILDLIEKNRNLNEDGLTGLDTGYKDLNKVTHGFQNGELIILAARPGIGKSAFALNVASNIAGQTGAHIALFSLEMGLDQILMRMYAMQSGVPLSKIRSGNLTEAEFASLNLAKLKIDKFNIYLDDAGATDVEEVVTVCRKLKREGKLDFVIIDYLQLLTTTKRFSNRTDEVAKISRQLKLMARELEVPVLALSQLSRDIEKRDDKRPVLSDLRESGSIEQDADIVMFLHREPTKGDEDTTKQFRNKETELIIAKNRQGMTDSVSLIFHGHLSMFAPKTQNK
ncbi:MAG TPA: replicative DNA helicase [Acholeplasmataceae bacterium]|nr:replicative DNA helicase [Acholeplasmataceae bacterium]